MALTINNTLSDETANSYITSDYADAYFSGHFSTAYATQWAALSATQKVMLLIRACSTIEQCRFTIDATLPQYGMYFSRQTGTVLDIALSRDPMKWDYYQKLQFPRNIDVYYVHGPTGSALGDRYIPEPIQIAQCEQAIYLLNFDSTAMGNKMQGISLEKIGLGRQAIETTQQYGGGSSSLAPMTYEMIKPYLYRNKRIGRG